MKLLSILFSIMFVLLSKTPYSSVRTYTHGYTLVYMCGNLKDKGTLWKQQRNFQCQCHVAAVAATVVKNNHKNKSPGELARLAGTLTSLKTSD